MAKIYNQPQFLKKASLKVIKTTIESPTAIMSQEINIMVEAKIPTAKLPLGLQAQIQAD
jgi:hypothetical protein